MYHWNCTPHQYQRRFSVTGWYKKGVVDDQSNKDINAAVNSGIISFYPVYISPTDPDELIKEDDESEASNNDVDLDNNYLRHEIESLCATKLGYSMPSRAIY